MGDVSLIFTKQNTHKKPLPNNNITITISKNVASAMWSREIYPQVITDISINSNPINL